MAIPSGSIIQFQRKHAGQTVEILGYVTQVTTSPQGHPLYHVMTGNGEQEVVFPHQFPQTMMPPEHPLAMSMAGRLEEETALQAGDEVWIEPSHSFVRRMRGIYHPFFNPVTGQVEDGFFVQPHAQGSYEFWFGEHLVPLKNHIVLRTMVQLRQDIDPTPLVEQDVTAAFHLLQHAQRTHQDMTQLLHALTQPAQTLIDLTRIQK